jgi:hypothetical protein
MTEPKLALVLDRSAHGGARLLTVGPEPVEVGMLVEWSLKIPHAGPGRPSGSNFTADLTLVARVEFTGDDGVATKLDARVKVLGDWRNAPKIEELERELRSARGRIAELQGEIDRLKNPTDYENAPESEDDDG